MGAADAPGGGVAAGGDEDGSARALLRASLEPVLAPHGFSFDERVGRDADPDRPWLLFHADPVDRLVAVHPGYAAHLLSRYGPGGAPCLDLWAGDPGGGGDPSDPPRRPCWRIDGDVTDHDLGDPALQAATSEPLEVWLPLAVRALTTWFESVDARFPSSW